LFPDITHVGNIDLRRADDRTIWDWAKRHGHTLVTTDADFALLSRRLGFPPKVIRLEQCDFPFRVIENLLRSNAVRITDFENDQATGVLRFAYSLWCPSDERARNDRDARVWSLARRGLRIRNRVSDV